MVRSRPRTGNETEVSILLVNGPANEKRLRWMRSIAGRREMVRAFVALRNFLHFGQFLWQVEKFGVSLCAYLASFDILALTKHHRRPKSQVA